MPDKGGGGGAGGSFGRGGNAGWKPHMTPAEADAWAKDSAIPGRLEHYTSAAAAKAIYDGGFDTDRSQTNQYFGRGIYLAQPGSGSTFYGDTVLDIRVKVKKPYTYLSDDPPLTSSKGPLGKDIAAELAANPGMARKDALTRVLKRKGYDAVIGREDNDDIVVVFDREHVTVVGPPRPA